MMRSLTIAFVWLGLFGWPASSVAQWIQSIVNAPFIATHRHSSPADGTSDDYEAWARSSDGSTFQARYLPGIAKDQKIDGPLNISIHNVSLGCEISVVRQTGAQDAFGLSSISSVHPGAATLEESRANLQRMQVAYAHKPDTSRPDASFHRVALGDKTVDGVTLYGVRTDVTRNGLSYTTERWDAELGFVYRETTGDTARTTTYFVTDLRRQEPDRELFVVPKEYLPHTVEFLSARTVFVQRSKGHEDVEARVLAILQQSGRFTVVDQEDKSDLTLTLVSATANTQTPFPDNEIYLRFHVTGQPVKQFQIGLSSPAKTGSWIDDHVIDSCLSNLWSRMESISHQAQTTIP